MDSEDDVVNGAGSPEHDVAPSPGLRDEDSEDLGAPNGVDEKQDESGKASANGDDFLDDEDDDAGLFGSGDEDEEPESKSRRLDDEELDSGDDEGRYDRLQEGEEDELPQKQEKNIMDVQLGRHAEPQPSDNELYLLKMPNFLGVEPRSFHHKTFQPPTTSHHSTDSPSSTFSPFNTALSTLRWRHSPKDPSQLQSNARILRWSDGSLTLQLASNPLEQYELPAKGLAPPQQNPIKPTPTSVRNGRGPKDSQPYNPQLDSYTYLVSPHEFSAVLRANHHVTTSLTVLPSSTVNDEALERLQESLSKAVRGNKAGADGGINVIEVTEDPELAKKKAEVAEREKLRAQRRREQQEARERDRVNRTLGRSGLRTGGMGGLTVGGLEDDEGFTTTRGARASRPRPSRADLSDEDDGGYHKGRTREDEYDEDDGFLVGSDEEEEVPEESEEEDIDDGIVERRESPKRVREPEPEDEDEGSEGGVVSRGKRRRVIEDDDEE